MSTTVELQKEIDTLEYPPTLTYQLQTLTPVGVLKQRMDIIQSVAPNFFDMKGQTFLDVGCNKGYFSLLAAKTADKVVSFDTDKRFSDLCEKLKRPNMQVLHSNFRDLIVEDEFDKVYIGNTHHYIFKEANGWDWVLKLAALCKRELLIEGPVNMECRDMQELMPAHLRSEFSEERFLEVMKPFFTLQKKMPSVDYTPDRYVMHFVRTPDSFQANRIQLKDLPAGKVLKDDEISRIVITQLPQFPQEVVVKIHKSPPAYFKMAIAIARFSPVSNGAIGSVYDGKQFVGWVEAVTPGGVYQYFENELALLLRLCDHEIFLSHVGYFDADFATINFFRATDALFDKGLVMPIRDISKRIYESFEDRPQGEFFVHLIQSFSMVSYQMQQQIYAAMKLHSAEMLTDVFLKLKNDLRQISAPAYSGPLVPFLKRLLRKVCALAPFLLRKYEDFSPISDTEALIAVGFRYGALSHIRKVPYAISGEEIRIHFWRGTTVVKGDHVRVGNFYNESFVFSDGQDIFERSSDGKIRHRTHGVQPYLCKEGLFYQYNGSVYLNANEIIRPWQHYSVIARPMYAKGWVYFETRQSKAPEGWEIWRHNMKTGVKERLIEHGANPWVYGDTLFYSEWKGGAFITRRKSLVN